MTRILMMSERRVIGRTPIFVIKYRTWRPRRTNQVAMSASNNRRAILVLFMTATQGAPNHHIRPRIGDFRADLAVAKPAVCRGGQGKTRPVCGVGTTLPPKSTIARVHPVPSDRIPSIPGHRFEAILTVRRVRVPKFAASPRHFADEPALSGCRSPSRCS